MNFIHGLAVDHARAVSKLSTQLSVESLSQQSIHKAQPHRTTMKLFRQKRKIEGSTTPASSTDCPQVPLKPLHKNNQLAVVACGWFWSPQRRFQKVSRELERIRWKICLWVLFISSVGKGGCAGTCWLHWWHDAEPNLQQHGRPHRVSADRIRPSNSFLLEDSENMAR